ncbi:MAG: 5-histidylcysteine sulfoxide synthase [Pseudomonadota bacterium]
MTVAKQAPRNTKFLFKYTGIPPVYGKCPGVKANGTITSLPQVRLHSTRQELLDYFNNSWTLTETLFSALVSEEAYYLRPYHKLRHPMIFYYGHVVSVYINKLRVAGLIDKPLNAEFEKLFEVGVDEMRWDDLHEGNQHIWPSLAEVHAYRKQAYELIKNLIETHPFLELNRLPITQDTPMWALVMGFEHERIHLETSSVLMREMPIENLRKPDAWPDFYAAKNTSPINEMISLPASEISLGKPHDFPTFGWDNEYGTETRSVRPFSASKQLISNGEFLEFVKAGGYAEEKYWSRDGWSWRRFRNVKWPGFWVQDGPAGSHLYKLRMIFEIIDMQHDLPAIVNFYEAKAYCAWKSECDGGMPYRLLTEAEHNAIRDGKESGMNSSLMSGGESQVHALPANSKGLHDVFGNVWQWCEDHFHPLTDAKPHPYYDDFSTPCYDGEHQMILGGSFISTGDEASHFARFHFRPHFFQHAGFRIARSEDGNPACDAKLLHTKGVSSYEDVAMLDRYLARYWGEETDIWDPVFHGKVVKPKVVNLAKKQVELLIQYSTGFDKAIDIGCAAGRTSFDLTRHFEHVVGIDYSHTLINAANRLKRERKHPYFRHDSAGKGMRCVAELDADINCDRIHFEQGDGSAIPVHFCNYDAVLFANVLCRLPDPRAGLERMQGTNGLVKPGGIVVMTTPFSWLEKYTSCERWIDGLDGISKILTEFELLHTEELPFLFREHRRRFEYIITLASVWRRSHTIKS